MKPKALISGIASLAILFGAADAVAQIPVGNGGNPGIATVSYTHLRAHET